MNINHVTIHHQTLNMFELFNSFVLLIYGRRQKFFLFQDQVVHEDSFEPQPIRVRSKFDLYLHRKESKGELKLAVPCNAVPFQQEASVQSYLWHLEKKIKIHKFFRNKQN